MEDIIFEIETATDHQKRLELLENLEAALEQAPQPRNYRPLISLLYHRDWYIRREAAFLIDRYGVKLKAAERLYFEYALQHFRLLKEKMESEPIARELLFRACKDPSERFRSRVTGFLTLSDCRTVEETALFFYAEGNYQALVELGCDPDFREAVISILTGGMEPENNSVYHRKQCAYALEQLQALENTPEVIAGIIRSREEPDNDGKGGAGIPEPLPLSPLEKMLRDLQQQGIRFDGKMVYPTIQIGSITNRITYREPGLQTLPKAERERRIQPPPGHILLSCDYIAMEPTLLLHFLLQRFLLNLEEIPFAWQGPAAGDIYQAIDPADRQRAKTWLNAVINGGGSRFAGNLNPFQMKLWEAIRELRQELLQTVIETGAVETIAGNRIVLEQTESNLGGKAVNRFIQGSASDVFNHAVLTLHRRLITDGLPARVYFLVYDEVWVETAPQAEENVSELIRTTLEAVNEHFTLLMPLRVRMTILTENRGDG